MQSFAGTLGECICRLSNAKVSGSVARRSSHREDEKNDRYAFLTYSFIIGEEDGLVRVCTIMPSGREKRHPRNIRAKVDMIDS